jgi:uncharacterized protein YqgQ
MAKGFRQKILEKTALKMVREALGEKASEITARADSMADMYKLAQKKMNESYMNGLHDGQALMENELERLLKKKGMIDRKDAIAIFASVDLQREEICQKKKESRKKSKN